MTEAQKISISIQDEIFKQAQPICDKLNECFLYFNDFGNYHKVISFDLYRGEIYHATNSNRQNKLYFNKYQSYKSAKRFTNKHLEENTFFNEFSFYDYELKYLEYMSRKKGSIRVYKKHLKDYMECLELFAEYIGYEMKIELYVTSISTTKKIYFKKVA
jgi:hypothetical protein